MSLKSINQSINHYLYRTGNGQGRGNCRVKEMMHFSLTPHTSTNIGFITKMKNKKIHDKEISRSISGQLLLSKDILINTSYSNFWTKWIKPELIRMLNYNQFNRVSMIKNSDNHHLTLVRFYQYFISYNVENVPVELLLILSFVLLLRIKKKPSAQFRSHVSGDKKRPYSRISAAITLNTEKKQWDAHQYDFYGCLLNVLIAKNIGRISF